EEIKASLGQLDKEKADFVKVALTGMMSFEEYGKCGAIAFDQNELNYIVKNAHDTNKPVMVHVNTKEGVQMALDAGADTIEHGYYLEEDQLQQMIEQDTIWVPTLAPLGNIIYSNDGALKNQLQTIRKIFDRQSKMIKKAYDLGVNIAVGSDSGAYRVYHGSGFFDELIYLNKAGIKKKELMKCMYQNGKKALRLSDQEINRIKDKNIDES
ncbi:MAG TPA: amidohydrolase, partial [Eubacteriaceae bacterium]|nr:amidohydrolase [Eubacteriaceae bacterium]